MKLTKMRYKTKDGSKKIFSYLINIPKRVVEASGIDDSKELQLEVRKKEIIIREK